VGFASLLLRFFFNFNDFCSMVASCNNKQRQKNENAKKKRKIIVLKVFISQGQVKHFFLLI